MSPRSTNWHEIAAALYGVAWEHPQMLRNQCITPGWSGSPAARKRHEVRGYWLDQAGPQHRFVSAVLTAVQLTPYRTASVELELWHNPWADHPLGDVFPFRHFRVNLETGEFDVSVEPEHATPSILGLWDGWPMSGEEGS
jgi:hypothetical protein